MPNTPPPAPPNTDPEIHRELQALKRWRDDAVASGRLARNVIRDTDLTGIVQYARKDVRLVRERLTAAGKFLAEEIVEVQVAVSAAEHPREPSGRRPETERSSQRVEGPVRSPRAGLVEVPAVAPAAEASAPTQEDLEQQRTSLAPRFARTRRVVRADPVTDLRIREVPAGLRLRWGGDPEAEEVTVYRVVSLDERPPSSPESGRLVVISYDATTVDTRPATAAVRYLRVFSNTGPTIEEAMEAQPRLVAEGEHVFSLTDVDVHEEAGIVTGQWPELAGARRVHVYRIPVEELYAATTADPRYRHETGEANLNGFTDRSAARGRTYQYDLFVEAVVGEDVELSDVTSVEVSVSASLSPVTDLTVSKTYGADGAMTFSLRWTRPDAGAVVIYRTQTGPAAGAASTVHEISALPGTELREDDRLRSRIVTAEAGVQELHDVSAPSGWSRVHLTPVTLLNGRARIGETVTQLIIGAPVEPEVVERCSYQLVKFGWPEGAAKVVVSQRPRDEPAALPAEGPGYAEIDREAYDRLGGMQLGRLLPTAGCSVHLAGVAYQAGDVEFGPPVAADYPGLVRLAYAVEQRRRFFQLDKVVVRISAASELRTVPAFVLVHRPDRLPLHVHDGTPLPVLRDVELVSAPSRQFRPDSLSSEFSTVGWSAGVRGLTGYVRLFVDDFAGRYALLDPPLSSLRLPPR